MEVEKNCMKQILVYKLFESWGPDKFEHHFKDIQEFYRERRDIMISSLEKHLTGLAEWSIPKGGMFVWVKITALEDIYDIIMTKCITQGVFILPGHVFYQNSTQKCQNIRICYSYVSKEEIDKGLSILAKVIKEEIASKNNGNDG